MTIPTDRELAQAYEQGWQDRGAMQAELVAALRALSDVICNDVPYADIAYGVELEQARAALAKVAQDQPATKGE